MLYGQTVAFNVCVNSEYLVYIILYHTNKLIHTLSLLCVFDLKCSKRKS